MNVRMLGATKSLGTVGSSPVGGGAAAVRGTDVVAAPLVAGAAFVVGVSPVDGLGDAAVLVSPAAGEATVGSLVAAGICVTGGVGSGAGGVTWGVVAMDSCVRLVALGAARADVVLRFV
jgi:hypothetical protein